ncbi:unnamed protein product [Paramecium sonneborni]|uniref:Cyclic nucleotide-binding domain-containing protein n=1 Tax=Paramecium sonneborni TaxID=65129 RepID=A0A8S1KCJ7_9CILI|nr:unnamed protein product [Paramecium sonneborni]
MNKEQDSANSSVDSIEMRQFGDEQLQSVNDGAKLQTAKQKALTISLIRNKKNVEDIYQYYKGSEMQPEEKLRLLLKVYNDDVVEHTADAKEEKQIQIVLPGCYRRFHEAIPIFYPNSPGLLFWKGWVGLIILFFFYEIPIYISFDQEVWEFVPEWAKIFIAVVTLVTFSFDLCLEFHTAYYSHGNLVMDRAQIAHRYLQTRFLFDLIATIALLTRQIMQTYNERWIYLLFYLKYPSLTRISFQFGELVMLHRRVRTIFQIAKVLAVLQFVFIVYACIWYLACLYATNRGYNSWLTHEGNFGAISELTQIQKFFYSYYFSVGTTTTTMGYGDMQPLNTFEVLVGMGGILFAVLIFAVMVNIIFKILEEYAIYDIKRYQQRLIINRYMMVKEVPQNLRERVRQYLNEHWFQEGNRDIQGEQEIIGELAPELKAELQLASCGKILLQIPLFCTNFSRGFLRELSASIQEMNYAEYEMIFLGQDPEFLDDQSIYFISVGSVSIFPNNFHKQLQLKKLDKGEYFGEYSFLTGFERKASAQALQYSQLYKISREDFLITLAKFNEDYEKYWMIKDKIEFQKDFSAIGQCYTCQSITHYSTECDVTHLVVDSNQLIVFNQDTSERKKFKRKEKKKWQTFVRIECFKREGVINDQHIGVKQDMEQKLKEIEQIQEHLDDDEFKKFQNILKTNFDSYTNQYEVKEGLQGMDQAFQFTNYFTQNNYGNQSEFINKQAQTKQPARVSIIRNKQISQHSQQRSRQTSIQYWQSKFKFIIQQSMKLVCRLRPQPNNTSTSTVNSRKEVRTNIFAGVLSNESPQTLVVSSRNAISQKIIQEYLKSDSDIMKQRQSIIENADLFQFDQVFGEKANQQLIYDQVLASKVNGLISGNSGTLLVMGGPESGKKYTLKGEDKGSEKGLALLVVENTLNLIEGSKQLKGKAKLFCSISLVNNVETVDMIGSTRSQTIKYSWIKSGSEFKKMFNQSLFQYKQYLKEHQEIKNNHLFIKFLIQQDKEEISQFHLILFNEFRRVTQESKDFQAKLKQLLIQLQDFQEKDLDTKSIQQLYTSLRETKFSNITTLFCVSQIQQDHITAYMTLQFADELRQSTKNSVQQNQRNVFSQIDNLSRTQLSRDNAIVTQQVTPKLSVVDEKTSRIIKPGSDQINQSKAQSMIERQPSRQEANFSRQFQELKELLKEKELINDYKVLRFEKELKNFYDENARLQNKVYQLEDSLKHRDLLIQQLEHHINENRRQMEGDNNEMVQKKQKENGGELNSIGQLNLQLRHSNEECELQKQKVRMLENEIEMMKDQEFTNIKHYEKREDEFMGLIQQEQERNKQLYEELDYFAVELKSREQELQVAEDNNKKLNKVIEEQCKRVDEERQKNKELNECINGMKMRQDEQIKENNLIEQRFTKLKVKLDTENMQLKCEREKYLQKYKEKLKKYKVVMKKLEQENGEMKMERIKLQTENDQLYGISKQLENQLGRVHSESTERNGGRQDSYEQDKIRQQNLQLNSQLKQADYEIQELSIQLNNAIKELERLSVEFQGVQKENKRLQEQVEEKRCEAKEKEFMIEKVVELSDKQMDDLEGKFNRLTAQVNGLQQEKKSLNMENQNLKQQLEQLEGNDVVLEKRIVKLKKENKDLSNQIKQLNQNMKEMIVEKNGDMRNSSLNRQQLQNQSYRSQRLFENDSDSDDDI